MSGAAAGPWCGAAAAASWPSRRAEAAAGRGGWRCPAVWASAAPLPSPPHAACCPPPLLPCAYCHHPLQRSNPPTGERPPLPTQPAAHRPFLPAPTITIHCNHAIHPQGNAHQCSLGLCLPRRAATPPPMINHPQIYPRIYHPPPTAPPWVGSIPERPRGAHPQRLSSPPPCCAGERGAVGGCLGRGVRPEGTGAAAAAAAAGPGPAAPAAAAESHGLSSSLLRTGWVGLGLSMWGPWMRAGFDERSGRAGGVAGACPVPNGGCCTHAAPLLQALSLTPGTPGAGPSAAAPGSVCRTAHAKSKGSDRAGAGGAGPPALDAASECIICLSAPRQCGLVVSGRGPPSVDHLFYQALANSRAARSSHFRAITLREIGHPGLGWEGGGRHPLSCRTPPSDLLLHCLLLPCSMEHQRT